MQLTVKKRLSETAASKITVPYYYRIDSKGNYLFGCVTKERHFIIRMISAGDMIRYETEATIIEFDFIGIEYSAAYQTFSASNEHEFAAALSEATHVIKTIYDALDIKR